MGVRTLFVFIGVGLSVLAVLWLIAGNSQLVTLRLPLFQAVTVQLWQVLLGGIGFGAVLALAFDVSGRIRRLLRERRRRRGRVELEEGERLFLAGVEEMASGRFREALLSFEASQEYTGADPTTLRRQAECLRRLDRPADAVRALEEAFAEDRSDPAVAYALAAARAAAGSPDQARHLLQKTIAEDPAPPPKALGRLRDLLLEAGEVREALRTQQHLVSIAPPSQRAAAERRALTLRHALGRVLLDRGETVDSLEAARIFRSVVEEDPRAVPAWVRLGEALLATGNEDAAVAAWKKGFETTGGTPPLVALQDYYLDRTCPEDAIAVWKQAIASADDALESRYLLGALYDRLYMLDEAIRTFSRLAPLGTSALDARLSRILESRGDLAGAMGRARQVIAAAPALAAEYCCSACGKRQPVWDDTCPDCGAYGAVGLDLETGKTEAAAARQIPLPRSLVL